ncbi:MAG: nucleotidyltransferase family protein [Clostridia bacterium]|nr:nucleotidyltransferase family protein [Clostridia bacterium]
MTEKYAEYLTSLCRNVIEGNKTEYIPDQMELGEFFEFCAEHRLESIAFTALSETDAHKLDEDVWAVFADKYYQSVFLDGTFSYYYDEITSAFRKLSIAYLPMKGIILKKLYPAPELRQSADLDIYIGSDLKTVNEARKAMERIGFRTNSFGKFGVADEYENDDHVFVDLHRVLFSQKTAWTDECCAISDRLRSVDEYERAMTDEDFYIYMVCHIAKHITNGGIGIRAILDLWVYLRHYKELNKEYIEKAFERGSLTVFHKRLMQLMDHWFNGAEADDVIKQMALYVAGSGWNGRDEQWVAASINANAPRARSILSARLRSYAGAIFWSADRLSEKYPVLEKHPALLPFCWVHRACNALVNKRDTVREVFHYYDGADLNAVKRINSFRKEIGL